MQKTQQKNSQEEKQKASSVMNVRMEEEKMKIAEVKAKVVNFLKENKWMLLKMGVMALAAGIVPDVSYAQTVNLGNGTDGMTGDGGVTAISRPLSRFSNLMTGPVPTAIATIGVAVGGASWAMNIENQVTKMAMRVVGGSSVAIGAAGFINQTTGFLIP